MNAVRSYLHLSSAQGDTVRWSATENVLEYSDGSGTFAFAEEIAEFIEGFAVQRNLIHFGLLMQMLQLLRRSLTLTDLLDARHRRLSLFFREHGKSLRHAGAFSAQLCRAVVDAVPGGAALEIVQRLRRHDVTIHWFTLGDPDGSFYTWEMPPISTEEFRTRVLQELDAFSDNEVRCWLEHGRWPVEDAARTLARELPVSLMGRLASLLDRPRLRGTKAFIPQLTGALTLPPRRLTYQDLPLGGYSDVTNRGNVDQLLLSQFALDEADFIRRFAEHELLFYRREDPNQSTRQELVVLLDRGVRTWGDIRLVLGAAVLALGKQAHQRRMSFYLASTRPDDPAAPLVDPLGVTEEQLGRLVEGSDLSANPGLALESVLETVTTDLRDVVLLTHPRNLDEPDVRAAARRVRPGVRLFAMSLDRHGSAALHEMRHGSPISIRQFHVDLSRVPVYEDDQVAETRQRPAGNWTGDVEPIGFPFLFGVDGKVTALDFDLGSRHLLTACRQGVLHLWEVGGSLVEMLPRAWYQEGPVTEVLTIVGVHGGFVVRAERGRRCLAVHYDLAKRRCKVHAMEECTVAFAAGAYSPAHDCYIVQRFDKSGESIDLGTGERFSTKLGGNASRAQDAWKAWEWNQVPRRNLAVGQSVHLSATTTPGQITVDRVEPPWKPFVPLDDGKPLLAGAAITEAQIGGKHLALRVNRSAGTTLQILHRDEAVVKSMPFVSGRLYRLSADGQLLGRQLANGAIQYGFVDRDGGSRQTGVGGFAQKLRVVFGARELFIFPGTRQHMHHLHWKNGTLICSSSLEKTDFQKMGGDHPGRHVPAFNDSKRWIKNWTGRADSPLLVAADCYGQVAVIDRLERLVCMFIAFRGRIAGWMPDGTCFGPTIMTGKPVDADAMRKFGMALLAAEGVLSTSASD